MKQNAHSTRTGARQAPPRTLQALPPSPAIAKPVAASQRNECDFLSVLRWKRVRICSLFGASVSGELVGIAKYVIKVRQPEGVEVVIPKGGIWTVEEMVP